MNDINWLIKTTLCGITVSKEQEQEDIDRLYDGGLYEKITTDIV